MINIGDFQIITSNERLLKKLMTLYTTPMMTVPFDRDFGLDYSVLDKPVQLVRAKLIADITEKTKRYITGATVKSISIQTAEEDSRALIVKVVIDG